MKTFDLEQYLNDGITELVKNILRATLKNPAAGAFFAKFALASKKAESRRTELGRQGEHIPSFLIASITGDCNLSCAGCYDRANQSCKSSGEMNSEDWRNIFTQAEEAGISAILLAGGEPLMRPDIIAEAAKVPNILFPVFTNGTMVDGDICRQFEKYRNLIPIISIEGNEIQTDARRGAGIYEKTMQAMQELHASGLSFGASITVTSETLAVVTSGSYIRSLRDKGCKAVVFVEYVPVETADLALSDLERNALAERVAALRVSEEIILISFPGDEKESGGCLAAGRGFFHINAAGGVEPCPFSPYSDTSLKHTTLREALRSPLFTRLREEGLLLKEHTGGCTLFEQADEVKSLLKIEL